MDRRLVLAGIAIVMLGGCSKREDDGQKVRQAEGRIISIDFEARSAQMGIRDKKGQERTINGSFRDDTEVLINGRSQEVKDLRAGDEVLVHGFREGPDENPTFVATKVVVRRAGDKDWQPTGRASASSDKAPE